MNVGQQPSSEKGCFGSLSKTVSFIQLAVFPLFESGRNKPSADRDDAHLLSLPCTSPLHRVACASRYATNFTAHTARPLLTILVLLLPSTDLRNLAAMCAVRCRRVATSSMCDRHAVACLVPLISLAGASTPTNTALDSFENAAFMDMLRSLQMLYNHTCAQPGHAPDSKGCDALQDGTACDVRV